MLHWVWTSDSAAYPTLPAPSPLQPKRKRESNPFTRRGNPKALCAPLPAAHYRHLLKRLLPLVYCSATRSPLFTLFSHWSACMATAASPRHMMYAQIVSQPALLLEVFDATARAIQDAFTRFQPQRWQAI